MALEGQKPSQWRCLTELRSKMYSQPIVHKALSRGIIRKSAPILAEITTRKSQYYIPDFSRWKDHDAFEETFARLLRDLKAEGRQSAS